ncbi:hypothetical protein D9M71_325950 [compost metagenome]
MQELPAALREQAGVATGKGAGVVHGLGVEPVDAADYAGVQLVFAGLQLPAFEDFELQAITAQALGVGLGLLEQCRVAEHFNPAFGLHQPFQAGGSDQCVMFFDAALYQRQHVGGGPGQAPGGRLAPVAPQPGCGLGQVQQAVAHIGLAVQAVAQQRAQLPGEGVGDHAGALDQPGVAVAGAAARFVAVDQNYLAPACLQVQRGADADDAGAEDKGLAMHGTYPSVSSGGGPGGLPGVSAGAAPVRRSAGRARRPTGRSGSRNCARRPVWSRPSGRRWSPARRSRWP